MNFVYLTILFYYLFSNKVDVANASKLLKACPSFPPYCECFENKITCKDFKKFSDLNFKSSQQPTNEPLSSFELILMPQRPSVYNDKLDLMGFLDNSLSSLKFVGLNGIDIGMDLIANIPKGLNVIIIESSYMYIYYNGTLVENESICVQLENADLSLNVFSRFDTVSLYNYGYDTLLDICPYAFITGNRFSTLIIGYTKDDRYKYMLNFMKVDARNFTALPSQIEKLYFSRLDDIELSSSTLNGLVFKRLIYLEVTDSYLTSIKPDAFAALNSVKTYNFSIENTDVFYRSSSNEWFNSLNKDVKIDLNNKSSALPYKDRDIIIQFELYAKDSRFHDYTYPDSDFCYFRYFPFDRLVFARIGTSTLYSLVCTCTIYWLIQNFQFSSQIDFLNTTEISSCFNNNLNESVKACQFERRLQKCGGNSSSSTTTASGSMTTTTTSKFSYSSKPLPDAVFLIMLCVLAGLVALSKHNY
jgi:hypothetical protein